MSKNITNMQLEEIYYQVKKTESICTALIQIIYNHKIENQVNSNVNIDSLYYAFITVDDMLDSIASNLDTYI